MCLSVIFCFFYSVQYKNNFAKKTIGYVFFWGEQNGLPACYLSAKPIVNAPITSEKQLNELALIPCHLLAKFS